MATLSAFFEQVGNCMAQDPVKVDPGHYTVEVENDRVRVLRIKYGPHEKSVMHGHPALVGVMLTDGQFRFTYPDGKSEEISAKAGQVLYFDAFEHLPENLGDTPFEVIAVELKGKAATAAVKAKAKPAVRVKAKLAKGKAAKKKR
jgi:quercetin dioxygenase-like cupin family protein